MSKKKVVICSVIAVILIYFSICITDFLLVANGNKPLFCIKDGDNNYNGFGYSYIIYQHPITGKNEYAFYVIGNLVRSTFTN
ncbi:MAG: hypothetical protein IJF09_00150 [Ruminiclostridium sp.]|nr:hypothetical protein [Ruminiclostridium sp.]